MSWSSILFWIVVLFILYVVIFLAVKDGIDRSEVGKLLINKYKPKDAIVPITDEEIEKELEDEHKKQD